MTRTRLVVAAVAAACLLSGCQRSAEELVDAVDDKPGVVDVEVYDNGGEADLPFSELPWIVNVTMKESTSRKQLRDVAHAYEEDMDDSEVEALTIKVGIRGTLEMGETTGETDRWADALAYGLEDSAVQSVYVSAWTPGPTVNVTSISGDIPTLQKYVRHYVKPYRLADFSFTGGAFRFQFTENYRAGQKARATARLRTATAVHERFRLRGLMITGSTGPLRLVVGPGPQLRDVRNYAEKVAAPGTGRIVVSRYKIQP